jgi:hypothetical protein
MAFSGRLLTTQIHEDRDAIQALPNEPPAIMRS